MSKIFIIRNMLLKKQKWLRKRTNIFEIQGLVKVNQFVYVNIIISVNVAILV